MAKESGLGWTSALVDDAGGTGRELRNDFTALDFSSPYDEQDVSGLNVLGYERLLLKQDYKGTMTGPFNPAANQSHDVFSGDLRVLRELVLVISAQTLTSTGVLFTEYKLNRAANGEFTFQNPWVLANGTPPVWT